MPKASSASGNDEFAGTIISFLKSVQRADGAFLSYTSADRRAVSKEGKVTIFFTSLVLRALQCAEHTRAAHGLAISKKDSTVLKRLRGKTANFLLTQESAYGSYNYWPRGSKEAAKKPYPDDIDDTVLALAALREYDPKLLTPARLANVAKLLIAAEIQPGGPYRTWLVPRSHPTLGQDVDVVVNANVRGLLAAMNVELPALEHLLHEAIRHKRYSSPYYYSHYFLLYSASRVPERPASRLMLKKLPQRLPSSILAQALTVSARAHFGLNVPAPRAIKRIFNSGFADAAPLGVEAIHGKRRYYSASPALTAALVLESWMHSVAGTQKIAGQPARKAEQRLIAAIERGAVKELPGSNREFRKTLADLLTRTFTTAERNEIILLPYRLAGALRHPLDESKKFLRGLAISAWYGWVGYTAADHVLDGEAPQEKLPYALALVRSTVSRFQAVAEHVGFGEIVAEIFAGMDEAVAWEQLHCRDYAQPPDYGNYEMLAKRSLGHAIAPLLVLGHGGYKARSMPVRALRRYFEHYIIARQLNDDAHDWIVDLQQGNVNSVAALLLAAVPPGAADSVKTIIPGLRDYFWKKGLPIVADRMIRHIQLARREFRTLVKIMNLSPLLAALDILEQSARAAVQERGAILGFLEEYKNKPPD